MDDTSATTSVATPPEPQQQSQEPTPDASTPDSAGFGSRGRIRRRARFLRKARELAYRDLGGLVFNLHRFGQRNDPLVLAKLGTLARIDSELRALEVNLLERQPLTVLREAGITACPRCAAIHSGEDRFCPNCGLPMSRNVDLPIAGPPAAAGGPPTASVPPVAAGAPPAAAPATVSGPASAPGAAPAAASAPQGAPPAAQRPPAAATAPSPAGPASGSTPGAWPPAAAPAPGGSQGRSPNPSPEPETQPFPAQSTGGEDQPTEIIRPPAAKS